MTDPAARFSNRTDLSGQRKAPSTSRGAWLDQWLKTQEPLALKPKAYVAYESQIRLRLKPWFGNRPLVKLQPQEVREFMKRKAEDGRSAKSIRHYRGMPEDARQSWERG